MQVSAPYAALVWTIAAFGLIRYLLSRRTLTYLILSRSLAAVAETEPDERVAALHLIPEAPWWLAPFPTDRNASLSAAASDALGYRGSEVRGALTILAFGLVVLAMEIAAIPAAVRLTLLFGTPIERLMVPALTVSTVALTAFALAEWMRPVDVAASTELKDDPEWWPDLAWPGWRLSRIPVATGVGLATMYLSAQSTPATAVVEILGRYPAAASIGAGATVFVLVTVWFIASSGWRWFAATHINHREDDRHAHRARRFGHAVAAGLAAAVSFQAVSAVAAPPVNDVVSTGRRRRRRTARPPRVGKSAAPSQPPSPSRATQTGGVRTRIAGMFRPHASADLKPWLSAVPVALVCGFELTREMFARRRPADTTALSRRQWVTLIVAIAAGSVFAGVGSASASTRTYHGRRRPRHWKGLKHSRAVPARVDLNEGFYRRSPTLPMAAGTDTADRSAAAPNAVAAITLAGIATRGRANESGRPGLEVAHYVNSDHTVAGAAINAQHFSRMTVQEVTAVTAPVHVHYSCASVSFERAALGTMAGSPDEQLALLLAGLRHDLRYKSATRERPDFRLFDLAAGLSARYDRADHLKQIVDLAKQILITHRANAFVSKAMNERLEKWSDPESPWRQYRKSTPNVPWNSIQIGRAPARIPIT